MVLSASFKNILPGFLMLIFTVLLAACGNDLQHIRALTQQVKESDTETTTNVEVIYSDSAKVKFKLNAPLILAYKGKEPRKEAPKGIILTLYKDRARHDSTIITADYAVATNNDEIFTLKRNVVIRNVMGDVFKSDELVLNQLTKKITSNKPSSILQHDGNFLNGDTFISNDDLSNPKFTSAHGTFNYKDSGNNATNPNPAGPVQPGNAPPVLTPAPGTNKIKPI